MPTTIIWFRNDIRVHDHPALSAAVARGAVIPVFIIDTNITDGKRRAPNRNQFLYESLTDLRQSLQVRGARLRIYTGKPQDLLPIIAKSYAADAVYYTADYTPYALKRDKTVRAALTAHGIIGKGFAGRLVVDSLDEIRTKQGTVHKIFTPFWRAWSQVERRTVLAAPESIPSVEDTSTTPDETNEAILSTSQDTRSPHALKGGELAAIARRDTFLRTDIKWYHQNHNDLASDGTSRLSAYLHFGCISALELESRLDNDDGSAAFGRQLAWRDFYHYIIRYFPANSREEFQEQYRTLAWVDDQAALEAWQDGRTGYPIVDAAMRQLQQEGWMHNRARLIVGSFLTKDLGIDWRHGETHFMRWLIDGDQANNNGNWQWIASVGVDPAPLFRRLYNPVTQQTSYDPTGAYVRRYIPELKHVPLELLATPWRMTQEQQQAAGCIIGKDYPLPIVDHSAARAATIERYAAAKNAK